MTGRPSEETTDEPITDPESLRGRADVTVHEDAEFVDEETVEVVAGLDDMAPVGVTNDEGEVLLWRLTEDCEWKLPIGTVARGEDYAEAARRVVEDSTGLALELHGVEGVWFYEARLEDEQREATRSFVVFGASPVGEETNVDDSTADVPEERAPEDVGWFEELPDDAEEAPGTRLFFD